MTLKQVAAYFCVSETSVRQARGDFAKLRRTVINSRTLIYRDSVEKLKKELDKQSYIIADGGLSKGKVDEE